MALVIDYLTRLGLDLAAPPPSPEYLRQLQRAHLEHVPFENLSIPLGEPLSLEPEALADKVLARNRGGFCYELNGLLAILLEHLGFDVTRLGARVWDGRAFGPPLDHLLLRVAIAGDPGRWLVDVGFGDLGRYPLAWDESVDLLEPGGAFRLEPVDHGDWVLCRNRVPTYRIEPHPRELGEFDAMCWYHQNSPRSHFTRSLVCTRLTETGRVTLSGRRLITLTTEGRDEVELDDDEAILDAYRTHFGINLPRVPTLSKSEPTSS